MSIKLIAMDDDIITFLSTIRSEKDLLIRLKNVKTLEERTIKLFRELKKETAYLARLSYASEDIANVSGCDRKLIDNWAKDHADNNGLPRLIKRPRADLTNYIDLTAS